MRNTRMQFVSYVATKPHKTKLTQVQSLLQHLARKRNGSILTMQTNIYLIITNQTS